MIKLEKTEVVGWEAAIRGMRNPMNSWEKSDSLFGDCEVESCSMCPELSRCNCRSDNFTDCINIGPNDHDLMMKLSNAGTDHRKFMRMIVVYVNITAPLYWWKEFDTYKVGTVANSCSTMHKIHDKEFELDDFSFEYLSPQSVSLLQDVIIILNQYRAFYNAKDDKRIDMYTEMSDECYAKYKKGLWWQMIQLLPSSYNQKRTVMLNYEVLANIYKSRRNHKLDEWRVGFIEWIKSLPYSELITGGKKDLVEVCRCKNCKYYISAEDMKNDEMYKDYKNTWNHDGLCRYSNTWTDENDVCDLWMKVQDTAEYAKEHPEWVKKLSEVGKDA